jgi:hypothetical protein
LKIKQLYDQGTDRRKEDILIDFPGKVMGVLDTGSEVFYPGKEQRFYQGMTGGQALGAAVISSIGKALGTDPATIVTQANSNIKDSLLKPYKLDKAPPSEIPFASYAFVFFDGKKVRIIQGGDCQIVLHLTKRTFYWTNNQTLEYDRKNLRLIDKYMEKARKPYLAATNKTEDALTEADTEIIRNAMWKLFGPVLEVRRTEYFNSPKGGFSLLNGQKEFWDYRQEASFDIDEVETMVVFTDGLVLQEETADMSRLASRVIYHYYHGGLQEVLNITREGASKKALQTHVTLPEALAIAIEF